MKIAYVFKDSVVVPIEDHLKEIDQFSSDYVKFKITPPNDNIQADFSKWTISQIGKEPHPDWWNDGYYFKVVEAFRNWHKNHLIFPGTPHPAVVNGTYYVFGDAKLDASGTAIVHAFDDSSIFASKKAKVFAYDYSAVRASGNSTVIAKDFSKIFGHHYANITLLDNSKAKVEHYSTVIADDQSFVKAYHSSQVIIYSDRSSAEIRGEAIAFVYGSGIIQAFDKSIIKVPYGIRPKILGHDRSIIVTDSDIIQNITNYDNSITINRTRNLV